MSLGKNQILAVAVIAIIIVAAVGVFMLNSGKGNSEGDKPYGTITIETPVDYNGNSVNQTYTEIPDRVVVGCNTALNLLLYLGLSDKIVGVYYMEEEVWDEVADEYDALVKRIGTDHVLPGNIQQSILTSWKPDCVIGWVAWTDSKLGSPAYWNELGCNVWSLHTMTDDQTLDGMKKDYENIGKVFDVEEKTSKYMQEFEKKLMTLKNTFADKKDVGIAINDGYSVGDTELWFYKTSGNFLGYILDYMGATNIFATESKPALATVYEKVPEIDILFLVCYGSVTYDGTLDAWKSEEILSTAPAIAEGNVEAVKLSVCYGSDPSLMDVLDYLVKVIA